MARAVLKRNAALLPMKNKDEIIREHMATIGAKGGKAKSPAKRAASRANGAKGGRSKSCDSLTAQTKAVTALVS
jgi:hypothetical protein